jgi:hypothetical protein
MTYKELMELLDQNPGLMFESVGLGMFNQTAATLLYWQTDPVNKPSVRREYRSKIRKAKDWEVSFKELRVIAGWARLDKDGVVLSLHPTKFYAEAEGCRVARVYLGEVEEDNE